MHIHHFIVTYKNPVWEICARSILATPTHHDRHITVINNHTEMTMPDDLRGQVTVIQNQGRPDFSQGHLSRNWNQALIHGFKNLHTPAVDIVVASQNDCVFQAGYLDRLIAAHQSGLDIITSGDGDNCVSYTARGVRRVGLWDERFCGIFYQEADYFTRCVKYLGSNCSINDHGHRRLHNVRPDLALTNDAKADLGHNAQIRAATVPAIHQCEAMFRAKWGGFRDWPWGDPANAAQMCPNYILYPYFENAVETLGEQQYVR